MYHTKNHILKQKILSENTFLGVYLFISFVIPLGTGGTQALCSGCKLDQVDFTDMMSFLPSNLMVDISPNSEAFSANT